MSLWNPRNTGQVRSTGAFIAIFSLGVALLGVVLNSFLMMFGLIGLAVGIVTFGIGYLAERRARHKPKSA